MRLNTASSWAVASAFLASTPAAQAATEKPFSLYARRVIFDAPAYGLRASYPRVAELEDGTLLVTTALSGASPPYFPVFATKDGGATWTWASNITDQVNGWGMGAQPALTELTEPMGGYEAGTVLAAGNSWKFAADGGTHIDLYASTDKARSWKFVSHIAEGGPPNTTNGADPVWEPFLMTYNHQLAAFYSDQRDPLHGQKLAHQTSTDLTTWGPVVNDVAYEDYIARPGMTVIAYIAPLKKYILVHEFPRGNSSSYGSHYPVYYRMASSPLEFDSASGIPLVVNNSIAPNASPYVVWSPVGGPNGTIVVSDADSSQVYTNRAGGDPDKWERHAVPHPPAYSRALHIFKDYPDHLMIISGSTYDGPEPASLRASVVSLTDILADQCHASTINKRNVLRYASRPGMTPAH